GVVTAVRAPGEATAEGRRVAEGTILAVVAAVSLGGFLVAIHASHGDLFWVLLVQRATAVALLVAAALATATVVVPRPRDTAPLVLLGLLDAGATTLFTASLRVGMLSVVAVVGSLYPVVTILLAGL